MDSSETDSVKLYRSAEEIEELVRSFETCEIVPEDFTHQAHLTVALWYLSRSPFTEAYRQMRSKIHHFLNHNNLDIQNYHETITLFWMKLLDNLLKSTGPNCSVEDAANKAIKLFGDSRFIANFYSKERLASEEARTGWIKPDLKQLEF